MNAPPTDQLRLLDLQSLDSRLDRLAHRRATLPELAELDRVAGRGAQLRDEVVAAETDDGDLARAQTKLENDVDLVLGRASRDQGRLDTGAVSTPKELESLQSEITSLRRRQDDLEEQVLEVMERREQVAGGLASLRAERDRLGTEADQLAARRDAAYADIDAETARLAGERGELAGSLPADLLARYERSRADHGGVGAAAMLRGRCEGCHLSLSGTELAEIRAAAPDAVLRCEECGRILVRTPESGL